MPGCQLHRKKMNIMMSIAATVKCSDGKCYPCQVVRLMTDVNSLLPSVEILFTGNRPEFVVMSKAVVNQSRIDYGGPDRNKAYYDVIAKAQNIIDQSKIIRR